MHVNLDSLFDTPTTKPQLTGVAVIDSCLSPVLLHKEVKMTISRTPKRGTPRKRVPPKQNDYVVVDKPSGHCPKCRKFVPEEGVVCRVCNAFWHYTCAGVSQTILDQEWVEKDFLCNDHRKPYLEAQLSDRDSSNSGNSEIKIPVKINSYTLNPSTTVNKLLSNLNIKPKIEPKDQNQQYYIKMSPPTFEILVANMVDLGKQWGISIKAGDTDNKGTQVGAQFNMNLCTQSGLQAQTSVNCHVTTSSIHIQLNKGTKGMGGWDEKVKCLSNFVTKTLESAMKQIEETEYFGQLKESMVHSLNQMKEHQTLYPNTSQDLAHSESVPLPRIAFTPSLINTHNNEYNPTPTPSTTSIPEELSVASSKNSDDDTDKLELVGAESLSPADIQESEAAQKASAGDRDADANSTIENLQKTLNNLRVALKNKCERIAKLESEITKSREYKKKLDEITEMSTAKDEKIAKLMKINENLGSTLITTKEKLEAAETEVKTNTELIENQTRTITQQKKAIDDLNCSSESHKQVAMSFMHEILDENNEKHEIDAVVADKNEMISKLYDEIEAERAKTMSLDAEKKECDSEIASLKLIMEENKVENKSKLAEKAKEVKSLKMAMCKLESDQTKIAQEKKVFEKSLADEKCLNKELKATQGELQDKCHGLQTKLHNLEVEHNEVVRKLNSTLPEENNRDQEMTRIKEKLAATEASLLAANKTALESVAQKKTHNETTIELEKQKQKYEDLFLVAESRKAELERVRELLDKKSSGKVEPEKVQMDNSLGTERVETDSKPEDNSQPNLELGNICFTEAILLGSCPKKGSCRFSHSIPPNLREHPEFLPKVRMEKEIKAAMCVNEFRKKRSCRKQNMCRFSHRISDEHRNDPALRQAMEDKFAAISGKKPIDRAPQPSNFSPPFSCDPNQRYPNWHDVTAPHDHFENQQNTVSRDGHYTYPSYNSMELRNQVVETVRSECNDLPDPNHITPQEAVTFTQSCHSGVESKFNNYHKEPQPLMSLNCMPPNADATQKMMPLKLPPDVGNTVKVLQSLLTHVMSMQWCNQTGQRSIPTHP